MQQQSSPNIRMKDTWILMMVKCSGLLTFLDQSYQPNLTSTTGSHTRISCRDNSLWWQYVIVKLWHSLSKTSLGWNKNTLMHMKSYLTNHMINWRRHSLSNWREWKHALMKKRKKLTNLVLAALTILKRPSSHKIRSDSSSQHLNLLPRKWLRIRKTISLCTN